MGSPTLTSVFSFQTIKVDRQVQVTLTGHSDVPLFPDGLVSTVGISGAFLQATVGEVHGGVAFVAAGLPILAGDALLTADSLDCWQGLVHKCVHWLASSLGHFPALHHQIAVVRVAAGGTFRVHVLSLEFLAPRFLAQGRLDPPQQQHQQQDQQGCKDEGLLQNHGDLTCL